jgi:hypothetical protein
MDGLDVFRRIKNKTYIGDDMKKLINLFVTMILVSGFTTEIFAEESPLEELLHARSIKCYWGKSVSAKLVKGTPQIEVGQWNPKKEDSYAIFDSIEIKNGKARLIAFSATDVSVLATEGGITFIEAAPSGNLSIVTVFPIKEQGSNKFIAVMSRHMYMFGLEPLPSQTYGTAEILE